MFLLKIFAWICKKLIKKGKKFDLNQNDVNDLQEWVDWIENKK